MVEKPREVEFIRRICSSWPSFSSSTLPLILTATPTPHCRNAPKGPMRYDQLVAEGLEDDETLAEEAAYRDRAWDNWKDENPRGSGNKMGKLF